MTLLLHDDTTDPLIRIRRSRDETKITVAVGGAKAITKERRFGQKKLLTVAAFLEPSTGKMSRQVVGPTQIVYSAANSSSGVARVVSNNAVEGTRSGNTTIQALVRNADGCSGGRALTGTLAIAVNLPKPNRLTSSCDAVAKGLLHHSDPAHFDTAKTPETKCSVFALYGGGDKRDVTDDDRLEMGFIQDSLSKSPCTSGSGLCFTANKAKPQTATTTVEFTFEGQTSSTNITVLFTKALLLKAYATYPGAQQSSNVEDDVLEEIAETGKMQHATLKTFLQMSEGNDVPIGQSGAYTFPRVHVSANSLPALGFGTFALLPAYNTIFVAPPSLSLSLSLSLSFFLSLSLSLFPCVFVRKPKILHSRISSWDHHGRK